ncbi:hypothetical protein [Streptomyces sp. NPDC002324]
MQVGGGRAERAGPELLADAVADRFRDQPVLPRSVEADLLSDLVGVGQVVADQGESGQAATPETGGVDQPVGQGAQVVVVRGSFRQAACSGRRHPVGCAFFGVEGCPAASPP